MRLVRSIFTALFIAGLLVALSGCGAPPVTFAALPIHPQASPLERGANKLADTVADSLESSLAARGTVELKLYSVPASVRWDEIDGFYSKSLADSDWKAAAELRQESAAINTTGWMRGSFASEQGLVVGYAPDMLGDGLFTVYAARNQLPETELAAKRAEFFSKGQPCLRSSPLGKTYGWGVHYDGESRIAIYPRGSEDYERLRADGSLRQLKAMRSSK